MISFKSHALAGSAAAKNAKRLTRGNLKRYIAQDLPVAE
jgi:hypothetical protein